MQLSVDDRVVHPIHGIGQVIEIKHEELLEGFEHYYIIQIPSKRLILHIPMSKIKEKGIRPPMSQAELVRVLDTLRQAPCPLPEETTKRQNQVREKLGTGHPLRVAEAVRDLTWHKHQAHLTKVDVDLLDWGLDLLTNEITLVTNTDISSAKREIQAVLKEILPATTNPG